MWDDSLLVMIRYNAIDGMGEEALAALAELGDAVMAHEPECLGVTVHRSDDDPLAILIVEEWTDREAFLGDHMQTPHMRDFLNRAVELFAGAPEFQFWHRTHEAMPE